MCKDMVILGTFVAGEGDQEPQNKFLEIVSNSLCNSDEKVKESVLLVLVFLPFYRQLSIHVGLMPMAQWTINSPLLIYDALGISSLDFRDFDKFFTSCREYCMCKSQFCIFKIKFIEFSKLFLLMT